MISKLLFIVFCTVFTMGNSTQEPTNMEIFPQLFTINCDGKSLSSLTAFPKTIHLDKLNISQCLTPETTYIDVLRRLNVDVDNLTALTLYSVANWTGLSGKQLDGLNLTELMIHNPNDRQMALMPRDLTDYLKRTLKVLNVVRVSMYPIPEDVKLESVALIRGYTLETWGGCQHLTKMDIMHWVTPAFKVGWLPHCTKLEDLTVYHASEQTVRLALAGLQSIRKLTVRKCALLYITNIIFADAPYMRELYFTQHSIYGIDPRAFAAQTELKWLDMSHNELADCEELALVYKPLRSLTALNLAYNPLNDFCTSFNKTHLPISRLSLRSTQLKRLCFSEWRNLTHLDLAANNITELQISELPRVHQQPLEVVLRKNPISKLPSTEEDYKLMIERFSKGAKVTLQLDLRVDCDCAHAWLARALHALPRLYVTGLQCTTGEDFYLVPLNRLECDKWRCGECWCRRSWGGGAAARCDRQDLTQLPDLQPQDDLATLPQDLHHIDLRDNRIAFVSAEAAASLFSAPQRTVRLAGNPLICDCDTAAMTEVFLKHRDQILDFDNLTCVNDGSLLSKVVLDDLCVDEFAQIWPVIAIVAVLATITSVLATLYWRYAHQIKMFLYTRGCCLSCLHEEDIDCDRTFDAFIAFSHEDDDFVNQDLIPGLLNYKLCVHYKNWIPGDWIPAQIARSIEQSKRTVIVLSKNFLKSPWGMLEFRMAHAAMLHEGRSRIIAVVTDDVIECSRLDAELRGYLAANTYIVWGDPWFFDKLRYALPHHKRAYDINITSTVSSEFKSIEARGFF